MATATRPGPFARKPTEPLVRETDGRARAQARRRPARPLRARPRRDHRHRHLRDHRRGDRRRRPVDRPLVRARGHHVRVLGAVLRASSRRRSRSPAARTRTPTRRWASCRLDHRLGPDPRVRRLGRRGRGRLGRLPERAARLGLRLHAARLDLAARPARAAPSTCRRCSSSLARRRAADLRRPRERAHEHGHGRHQDRRSWCSSSSLGFTAFNARQLLAVRAVGLQRDRRRRVADLLRLHRLRRRSRRPARRPRTRRSDLPIAIIGSLAIATLLYILVAIAAIGALPLEELAAPRRRWPTR